MEFGDNVKILHTLSTSILGFYLIYILDFNRLLDLNFNLLLHFILF